MKWDVTGQTALPDRTTTWSSGSLRGEYQPTPEVLLLTPGGVSETVQPPPPSLHLSRAEDNQTTGITPNPRVPPDPRTPPTSTALPQCGASTQRHSPFLLFDSRSALGNKSTPWKEVNYKCNEKVPPSVSVAFSLVHRTAHRHRG